MMRNSILISLLILLGLSACIKTYEPEFKEDSVEKWVIEGSISNQLGWQEVRVSKSSSYDAAFYYPVEDCQLQIVDELGQIFQMENAGEGLYRVWMTSEYLIPGRSYHLEVTTPNGEQFASIPDKMPNETNLDEAYFEIEDMPTQDPEVFVRGLQFYVDLNALEESNQYYRWRITETWEYKSAYPKEFWYDGEMHQNIPPDSSTFVCWSTQEYDQIFTLSTELFVENQADKIPLQFVSSETEKLAILYSFLLEQVALTEETFGYWQELGENVNVGEGLYASQPLAIKGNIRNVNDPDQSILGNFQAIYISSKRYFIEPIADLELVYSDKCSPAFLRKGLREIYYWEYPAYLMTGKMNQWIPFMMNYECVDCTMRGGSTVKPDFWPW